MFSWGGSGRCWCLLKECIRSSPELWWHLTHCGSCHNTWREFTQTPPVLLHRTSGWRHQEGEGQRGVRPTAACEQSKGSNCRFLHRQQMRDGLEPTRAPPCISTAPLWEQRFWYLQKWKHMLNRNRARSGLNLRASAVAVWDPLGERKSCLTTSFSSNLSIPSHTLYQGCCCWHTLRKHLTCISVRSSSATSVAGAHSLCRDAPAQVHRFKIVTGRCVTKIHRGRKC